MNKTAVKGIVESSVDVFVPFMKKDYDIDIVGVWVRHCEKVCSSFSPSKEHFKVKDAVEHYIMYIPMERRKAVEEDPSKVFIYTLAKCLIHNDGRITNVENLMDYRSELNYEAVGKEAKGRKRSLKNVIETVKSTLFSNTYYEGGRSDYFPIISTSRKLKQAFSSKTCVFEGEAWRENEIIGYTPDPDWEEGNDYLIMTDEYGCLTVNEKGEYMFSNVFNIFGTEKFKAFNSIPFWDFHPIGVFKAYRPDGKEQLPLKDGCAEHIILYTTSTQNRVEEKDSGKTYKYYTRMARCLIAPDGTIGNIVDVCSVPGHLTEDIYKEDGSRKLTWDWIKEFKTNPKTTPYCSVREGGKVYATPRGLYRYLMESNHKPFITSCDLESTLKCKIPGDAFLEYVEYGNELVITGNKYGDYKNRGNSSVRFSGYNPDGVKDDDYELNVLASFKIMDFVVDESAKELNVRLSYQNLKYNGEKMVFYTLKNLATGQVRPIVYLSRCTMNSAGEIDIVGNTWDVFNISGMDSGTVTEAFTKNDFSATTHNLLTLIVRLSSILNLEPLLDSYIETEEFLRINLKVLEYEGSGSKVIPLHEYATLNKDKRPFVISVDNLLPNHMAKRMGLDADFYKGLVHFYHTKTICHGPLDLNVDRFDILDPHISVWNTDKEIWDKDFYLGLEYGYRAETLREELPGHDVLCHKLLYSIPKTDEYFNMLSKFENDLRHNDERANVQQRRDLIRRLIVTLELDPKVGKVTMFTKFNSGEVLYKELKIKTDFEFLLNHRLLKTIVPPIAKEGYEYYALQGDKAKI